MRRFYINTFLFVASAIVFPTLLVMALRVYSPSVSIRYGATGPDSPDNPVAAVIASPTVQRTRASLPNVTATTTEMGPAGAVVEPAASEAGETPSVPSGPLVDRLTIPVLGVDAPVIVLGLDADRMMQSPDDPFQIAWYDFTSLPGQGSNAVFAGHFDFRDVGPAVFWNLGTLNAGDVINVHRADGVTFEYQVKSIETYDEASAPVGPIVESTAVESITLITCAGTFDPTSALYDQRLVVRAELIPSATP